MHAAAVARALRQPAPLPPPLLCTPHKQAGAWPSLVAAGVRHHFLPASQRLPKSMKCLTCFKTAVFFFYFALPTAVTDY